MPDESTITAAADLAEQIVDEISRAEQNWLAVEHMADALAELAAQAGRSVRADRHVEAPDVAPRDP